MDTELDNYNKLCAGLKKMINLCIDEKMLLQKVKKKYCLIAK